MPPRTRIQRPACRWYRYDKEREHGQDIFRGRCPAVVAASVSVYLRVGSNQSHRVTVTSDGRQVFLQLYMIASYITRNSRRLSVLLSVSSASKLILVIINFMAILNFGVI